MFELTRVEQLGETRAGRLRLRVVAAAALAVLVGWIALAPRAAAHIYWVNTTTDTIGRANLDGSGVNQTLVYGADSALRGVAVDGAHLYWTNQASNTIGRA